MTELKIETAHGDTGAVIVAVVQIAAEMATALTRPRFNKDQAGAWLMSIASTLRSSAEQGFLDHASAMKIVDGLEVSAEQRFGVKPRQ